MLDLIHCFLAASKHAARKEINRSFPKFILFVFQFVTSLLITSENLKKRLRGSGNVLAHFLADFLGRF